MCAAGAIRNPRLGFTFMAPPGFTLDNSTQAVFGVKDGGGQALRLDIVRVPADQALGGYLNSGWIEGIDAGTIEETTVNTLPRRHRGRQGRPVDVPPLCGALRQRRVPLHLRRQAADA